MNITNNGRNTKAKNKWKTNIKAKKNWKRMRSEIKNKITKQRLQQLKEKKINQLRSKKMQKKRKLTSHKRRIANKQFDCSESKFHDHCRNAIKSDMKNERPTYTDKIRRQSTTDHPSSLAVNVFNDFWKPNWKRKPTLKLNGYTQQQTQCSLQ